MRIKVNGENMELSDRITIAELVAKLEINPGAVVVELNREIVDNNFDKISLSSGDVLEIVRFVGGG